MPADFLDSNILIYASSSDPAKSAKALSLISSGGTISVQVLNEFANVSRRKAQKPWNEIKIALEQFRKILNVTPLAMDDHQLGVSLAERHRLPVYDAVIAASALNAGCDRLWTEDLHHGLVLEGKLRIENPFLAL